MFPVEMTAGLTGATPSQLHHWSRTGLLSPQHGTTPQYLYSFRDIVALRTVVSLRVDLPLQRIRTAFGTLAEMDLAERVSELTLMTDGDSVFLIQDDAVTDLVRRKNQSVLAPLADVFAAFTNKQGREVADLRQPRPNLQIREARLGGWPTILQSRVPFDLVADLAHEVTPERVHDFYPGVSAAAARDALDFQRSLKESV